MWRPTVSTCHACGDPVFFAPIERRVVAVEPREIESPRLACPRCAGRPRKEPCERCDGTGKVGERLPDVAIGIDEHGKARLYRRNRTRLVGEALYRPHACGARRVA